MEEMLSCRVLEKLYFFYNDKDDLIRFGCYLVRWQILIALNFGYLFTVESPCFDIGITVYLLWKFDKNTVHLWCSIIIIIYKGNYIIVKKKLKNSNFILCLTY